MSRKKVKILFICTGNAGRSQMAEAMFRKHHGDGVEIFSGGVEPWDNLHPMAVKLMNEEGISMDGHFPEHVKKYIDEDIDVAITIGAPARDQSGCFRTGTLRIHWPIDDPADADGTSESENVFRWTRQAILDRFPELVKLVDSLKMRLPEKWETGISTCALRRDGVLPGEAAFKPELHVPMIKKARFDIIELCCYMGKDGQNDFQWKKPGAVKQLSQICLDSGICVDSVHTPELRLCGSDKPGGEKTEIIKAFIDICLELNSRILVLHYFPEKDSDYSNGMPEILSELDSLVCDKPLTLALETLQQKAANSKLVNLFEHLNPTSFASLIDTGHCNIAGDLYEIPQAFGRTLKALHLNDNDSAADQHLCPGKGNISWGRFAQDLNAAGYEGALTLEITENPTDAGMESHFKAYRESLDLLIGELP